MEEMNLRASRKRIKISDTCYLRFLQYIEVTENTIEIKILFLTGEPNIPYYANNTNQVYISFDPIAY